MNRWQIARQVRHVLAGLVWPDTSDRVFGAVFEAPDNAFEDGRSRLPYAKVIVSTASARETQRRLWRARVDVVIVARNDGDGRGTAAVVGGPREDPGGSSNGAGVLELEERVLAALTYGRQDAGFQLELVGTDAAELLEHQRHGTEAAAAVTFETWGHHVRTYERPTGLAIVGATLTWDSFVDRFDRHSFVLRRGSDPDDVPQTPTEGGAVVLPSELATSVTDPSGAAPVYSLFCMYDDYGEGAARSYSPPLSLVP